MRPTELLPWIAVTLLGDCILPAMYIKGFILWSGFRRNWSNSCFCIIENPLGCLGGGKIEKRHKLPGRVAQSVRASASS